MARISYRTPDDCEVAGRPRVFLAAHPSELPYYLEQVVSWLHACRDCVIWYPSPSSGDSEGPAAELKASEVPDVLDDMQLVVVAVTMNLLRGDNAAMDRVIPYAQSHHIPLLPLIMEPEAGMDPLYKVRFRDLQYLEPSSNDPTAIPFADKLKAYLSDVLVSDETAARVREAFDACVFLSYRKKDRAFARELMRMVHRDPKYRGISFWYDEFLTPGEDFNESIEKALKDCDLFALVVTPSMLEIPNFVMDKEYPLARSEGKDIFPVEMDRTDRELLQRHFQDIPACVVGVDDDAWSAALSQKLAPLAVRTLSGDPEHTYLTGLAYLDGIGVEVDLDVAVELITEAYNEGLEEAARKLSAMYLTGKGVPQSVAKALGAQSFVVDIVRKRYRESGRIDDLEELYREQRAFDDRCWEMKARYSSADDLMETCRKLCEADIAGRVIVRADCLMRRARSRYWDRIWRHGPEEAEADFTEALRLLDDEAARIGQTEDAAYLAALTQEKLRIIREMAMMEQYKSEVLTKKDFDMEKAASVHGKWFECAVDLQMMQTGPSAVAEQMKAHRQLGDIYAKWGLEEDAICAYEHAAKAAVHLLDMYPSAEYKTPIAYIYDKLESYEERRGNYGKLREYRTRECAVHTIAKDPNSAKNRSLYPLFDQAERAMIHGETDLAKSLYLRCAAGEGVDADPLTLLRFENWCLFRLDYFAGFVDRLPGESWEYRCRHLENQERITSLEHTHESRRTLAKRYGKMAGYAARIDPRKALAWYRGCIETWDSLAAETGSGWDGLNRETARLRLAYSGLLEQEESDRLIEMTEAGLAKIAEDCQGTAEAASALTELGRLYRKQAESCLAASPNAKDGLAGFEEGAVAGRAVELYGRSIATLQKAAETDDPEPALEELKSLYLALDANGCQPHFPNSFEKALETQRTLLKSSITKSHLEDMGDLLFRLVDKYPERIDAPAEAYQELIAVYNRLAAEWPETQLDDASCLRSRIALDMLTQKNEWPSLDPKFPWLDS